MVVAAGIVLFLLVEKIVRYVEDNSGGANATNHSHHHYNNRNSKKLKDDSNGHNENQQQSLNENNGNILEASSKGAFPDGRSDDSLILEKQMQPESQLQKVR